MALIWSDPPSEGPDAALHGARCGRLRAGRPGLGAAWEAQRGQTEAKASSERAAAEAAATVIQESQR